MSSFCKLSNCSYGMHHAPFAFFPFHLSWLFESSESSGKSSIRQIGSMPSRPFFHLYRSERHQVDASLVNSIKRFHLHFCTPTCRRLYFFPESGGSLFLIWHQCFRCTVRFSFCSLWNFYRTEQKSNRRNASSRSKCNIQFIWIYNFRRYEYVGNLEHHWVKTRFPRKINWSA